MTAGGWDALVVGGGFYGCSIALHLKRETGLARVAVVERGPRLLGRASLGNQARVHGGYHYPRDFTTAYRSRANFRKFVERYRPAIVDDFLKLYAVATRNSRITARQFERAMAAVGAPCAPASRPRRAMFSPSLIEAVFEVEEFAFDADRLADMLANDLEQAGVDVLLDTEVSRVLKNGADVLATLQGAGDAAQVSAGVVFNCAYGNIEAVRGVRSPSAETRFQIAELCLVEPPPELHGIGVTVMDGPFFSCMPFPTRGLHSLSHVAYTPRAVWSAAEEPERDPYAFLDAWPRRSAFGMMVRDAARLLPAMAGAVYRDSIFEIKALLVSADARAARPILFEGVPEPGGVVSVLGGKLDNVFDVLDAIDGTGWLGR